MTAEVSRAEGPTQAELINLLDPGRDYGERTYEAVVAGVKDGSVLIHPGQRLPVLRDARTGRPVKGTGQPPQDEVTAQQRFLSRMRTLALDDVDDLYAEMRAFAKSTGDPRHYKNILDLFGKVGEVRGGDEIGKALQMLIERMETPEKRSVVIEQ